MSKLRAAFASPEHKRQFVRRLFSTIADRYDLITVVLSGGQDRAWKRRLVREARVRPGTRLVDVACGTGDIAFLAAGMGAAVIGVDITPRMIELAHQKSRSGPGLTAGPRFAVGDMVALPLVTGCADVVTTGYGLRNVPQLADAVDEIARVLAPGGRFLSLDFNRPEWRLIRWPYLAYLTIIGSLLGWILHRDPDTYRYIPESVRRYPGASGIADLLRARGFAQVRIIPILGGLMTIHVAAKEGGSAS